MNKKHLILISVVVLLVSTILSGCGVKTSYTAQKIIEYNRTTEINTAKSHQELVKDIIAIYYAKDGKIPQKSDIEEGIHQSLESIKISVTDNGDGTVAIKNTNQELTNIEVPDLVYNPKE